MFQNKKPDQFFSIRRRWLTTTMICTMTVGLQLTLANTKVAADESAGVANPAQVMQVALADKTDQPTNPVQGKRAPVDSEPQTINQVPTDNPVSDQPSSPTPSSVDTVPPVDNKSQNGPAADATIDDLTNQVELMNAQQAVIAPFAQTLANLNWWDIMSNIVEALGPALLLPLNEWNSPDMDAPNAMGPTKDSLLQTMPLIIGNIWQQGQQSLQTLGAVNTQIVDDNSPMNESIYALGYVQKDTPVYVDAYSNQTLGQIDDYNVPLVSLGHASNGRLPFHFTPSSIGWVDVQATTKSRQVYYDDYGISHLTRENLQNISQNVNNPQYQVPRPVSKSLNQELEDAVLRRPITGRQEPLNVWDSWPVQNPDGTLANFHGYHLVIGLTAPAGGISAKMGLFSQPIDGHPTGTNSWTYLGYLFNQFGEGAVADDPYLKYMQAEWSGSTVMLNPDDNTLRVFYTNHTHLMTPGGQVLTTAQITIDPKNNSWTNGLFINHSKTTDHRSLYAGDGKLYQNQDNMAGFAGSVWDDYCLRDPHLVFDNNQYYLVFEGNTSTSIGNQGLDNFYNQAYYTSDKEAFIKERQRLIHSTGSKEYQLTYLANAAIGIMSLNPDFTVKEVMKPLVTANAVNDELERPNLIHFQNKWYLFTDTRGDRMASTDVNVHGNDADQYPIYMLGFVSEDGINGHYQPLNGNGLVLVSNIPKNSPDFTYAHYVIPNQDPNNNEFVVTAYLHNKSFAPSLLLKIDGHSTTMVTDHVLGQGDLVVTPTKYPAYLGNDANQQLISV